MNNPNTYFRLVKNCSSSHFGSFYSKFILNVASPIFNRYESSALISVEYRRRIVNQHISPRRCHEKGMGKSIFNAGIVRMIYPDDVKPAFTSIDIYRCYPDFKKITPISFPASRVDAGWTFHGGRFYQMGGYYSAEGGRTSAEVKVLGHFHIKIIF